MYQTAEKGSFPSEKGKMPAQRQAFPVQKGNEPIRPRTRGLSVKEDSAYR